jgi:hypothetical protein
MSIIENQIKDAALTHVSGVNGNKACYDSFIAGAEFIQKSEVKNLKSVKLAKAVDTLRQHLAKDTTEGSYFHTWQSNIAMAFVDAYQWKKSKNNIVTEKDIHSIANDAAVHFLNLLIK